MEESPVAPEIAIDAVPAPAIDANGAARLLALAGLARRLGAGRASDEARDLANRVSEGRFYVACLGQFKRGKSTLINALIGRQVLPTGFVPVTAVPTVIRYGEELAARVRLPDGSWREIEIPALEFYVSEERNPRNAKQVSGVEVFAPGLLLESGLCLVDTPGVGSVFTENNAATAAFIPHIDAALIVLGADPPLSGDELSLIQAIAPRVEDVLVVLNKADRATDAERSASARFARDVLQDRLGRDAGPIFEVSATERLDDHGPGRDWRQLNDALLDLVRDSGRQLVRAACERGVERLSEELLAIVAEQRDALRRPVEESERRIAALKEAAADAEQSLVEVGFLMMAEQHRICSVFAARHQTFLDAALPMAQDEFRQRPPRRFGPAYRRLRMSEAGQIARRHLTPWLRVEQEHAEAAYRRATTRFVALGNELLAKLAQNGLADLSLMPHALDAETGFRVRSRFSFAELIELAQPASPLRWLADAVLGCAGAHGVIEHDASRFLERLLETNAARVQSDIVNRLDESRGRLEADLRRLLHGVVQTAERAVAQAKRVQESGAAAVKAAVESLDDLEREIRGLQAASGRN